jgi:hypothetical protein
MFRIFLFAGVFAVVATTSPGDSEVVIAIRYLQPKGTSRSHLYLYREDGKLLRQLTNDNSGQDVDPIFAPEGEAIVFTREKANDAREFWSIDPRGTGLTKLEAPPAWYAATKSSPYFTNREVEETPTASPAENVEQNQHSTTTALDATVRAEDQPPATIKAPDGSGEIFWRKGDEKDDPLDWVMWFRDSKSDQETKIGKLPGFPSFSPLHLVPGKDQQFLFEGPLRLTFFDSHLNSTDGDTVVAFDFNKRKLIKLSPNWATPVPLPGESGFLTLTENRYVEIPGSKKTANCSYLEHWGANLKEECHERDEDRGPICDGKPEVRYARKESAAICYGASMYRPGKDPAVITIRSRTESAE